MLMKWWIGLCLAFFMVGCSNEEIKTDDTRIAGEEANKQEKSQNTQEQDGSQEKESWITKFEEAPEAPLTEAGIVNQVKGPYGNAELFKETQEGI